MHRAHARRAGFTLVELMVAMTGGLFLSLAVMALSRDFSQFTQQSIRLSNATLSSANGFDRLTGDLARAGHLVTANIDRDPRVCNRPGAEAWPTLLGDLRVITLDTSGGSVANTEVARAGISPMAITIAGALDVTEELTTTLIQTDSGVTTIGIRVDTPAAARLGLVVGADEDNSDILEAIFAGRAIRLAQTDGLEQYAVVKEVDANPLQLKLETTPALKFRVSDNSAQCGVQGLGMGATVNVINFVRYQLRPLRNLDEGPYKELFRASDKAGLPYEAGRVELVREELDPAGVAIEGTEELVAEYATDLQFTIMKATSATDSTLQVEAPASVTLSYPSTQLIRAVRARLSVRSREADRNADVAGATEGQYRIGLRGAGGTASEFPYARVRSLQADVPLRNLEGANWD